jgi:hypothetical protein
VISFAKYSTNIIGDCLLYIDVGLIKFVFQFFMFIGNYLLGISYIDLPVCYERVLSVFHLS